MTGAMAPRLAALLTITQVADLLGVSRHVVRRWCERGVMPSVRLDDDGKGIRWIPLSALKARAMVWDSVLLLQQMRVGGAGRGNARG